MHPVFSYGLQMITPSIAELITRENVRDAAQVLTAIGTIAAAWSAVWVARRAETPRIKLFAGLEYVLTVGQGIDEQHKLRLSIVNSGILPVTITNVSLKLFFTKRKDTWSTGLEPRNSTMLEGRFPQQLEHGQEIVVLFTISPSQDPWRRLPWHWWFWRRPIFSVYTTVRKGHCTRPSIRTLWHLKRDLDAFYKRNL